MGIINAVLFSEKQDLPSYIQHKLSSRQRVFLFLLYIHDNLIFMKVEAKGLNLSITKNTLLN